MTDPSGYPQYQYGQQQPYGQPQQRTTNSMAIASLICGIAGLVVCSLVGIVAIVLGNRAKAEIAASGGMQEGEGMAKAGVILGWIAVALTILGILIFGAIIIAGIVAGGTS